MTDRPVDAVADLLDDSSGFMTEQDRHRPYRCPSTADRSGGYARSTSVDRTSPLRAGPECNSTTVSTANRARHTDLVAPRGWQACWNTTMAHCRLSRETPAAFPVLWPVGTRWAG